MASYQDMPSITEFVDRYGITCEVVRDRGSQVEDGWEHHAYVVRLVCSANGQSIETPWGQGYGIETSPSDTPADVLDSLVSDAWGYECAGRDFEEWAGEYGYDSDSLKAYRTFEAVAELYPRVVNFLAGTESLESVATEYERL